MMRSEIIHHKGEAMGRLRCIECGVVVFDPIDDRPAFNELRVMTWKTVEQAKAVISVHLMREMWSAEIHPLSPESKNGNRYNKDS